MRYAPTLREDTLLSWQYRIYPLREGLEDVAHHPSLRVKYNAGGVVVRLVPLAVACTIDAIPRTGYCPSPRAESGKPWHSTLITSAPISAIMAEATGPATTTDMSMTTTPARGPFAASLMIAPSTNFFRIVPASLYIIYYATSNRIAQRQHTSIQ